MTPVFQTRFGKPHGNCFAACVVSLIGGSIEDFPDLSDLAEDTEEANTERKRRIENYVGKQGCKIDRWVGPMPSGVHVIAVGEGASGLRHACVYLDGKLAHDPNSKSDGLKQIEAWYMICPQLAEDLQLAEEKIAGPNRLV